MSVGAGAFFSDIVAAEGQTLFSLPPRYRGHEETLAQSYGMEGVHPIGFRKAWGELRELLGGRALKGGPLAA